MAATTAGVSLRGQAAELAKACHPGPALAVTALATAYAVSAGLDPSRVVLVAAAVLAGQLSIGWSNDLIDLGRDRAVGRTDKPLAAGTLPESTARVACAAAVVATVILSLACGAVAGAVHLGCVAAGWAYNLGAKATVLSWLPYAIAFGGLPVFITLAERGGSLPPWPVPVAGALLGIGAHLVNVLPDLADDEATGVRGLAHRIGYHPASALAVTSLAAATAVLVFAVDAPAVVLAVVVIAVLVLAGVALVARGRVPFRAAIAIAVVDVLLLVVAG